MLSSPHLNTEQSHEKSRSAFQVPLCRLMVIARGGHESCCSLILREIEHGNIKENSEIEHGSIKETKEMEEDKGDREMREDKEEEKERKNRKPTPVAGKGKRTPVLYNGGEE
ncbi:hypothetical protein SLEP1_g59643 [Rubroshorea leprosula]|uniref:Uncharacterized protein n=1 Tax=Rubroshorea leprosula TaxID=152421 RepID=A0AAV5MSX3_9ROSI|nr:hypothetical protein SLEP1_g59643 [Rubroshorea leprosula]